MHNNASVSALTLSPVHLWIYCIYTVYIYRFSNIACRWIWQSSLPKLVLAAQTNKFQLKIYWKCECTFSVVFCAVLQTGPQTLKWALMGIFQGSHTAAGWEIRNHTGNWLQTPHCVWPLGYQNEKEKVGVCLWLSAVSYSKWHCAPIKHVLNPLKEEHNLQQRFQVVEGGGRE